MVYLNLPVFDIEASVDFYANKLGFFDQRAGRLVCNMGVDLVLDLQEVGSEKHASTLGQKEYIKSSFWINVTGIDEKPLFILEHLNSNQVTFEEVENLGGHHLSFRDPSGNVFGIHANLGIIR